MSIINWKREFGKENNRSIMHKELNEGQAFCCFDVFYVKRNLERSAALNSLSMYEYISILVKRKA